MTTKTKPTTDQCKAFTDALGEEWHEEDCVYLDHYMCSCGFKVHSSIYESYDLLLNHIAESNPTYSNPADILRDMREKLGEEKFDDFMYDLGNEGDIWDSKRWSGLVSIDYIFNPRALIEKALEWMGKEGE